MLHVVLHFHSAVICSVIAVYIRLYGLQYDILKKFNTEYGINGAHRKYINSDFGFCDYGSATQSVHVGIK